VGDNLFLAWETAATKQQRSKNTQQATGEKILEGDASEAMTTNDVVKTSTLIGLVYLRTAVAHGL
jgi:hypothetical protein